MLLSSESRDWKLGTRLKTAYIIRNKKMFFIVLSDKKMNLRFLRN